MANSSDNLMESLIRELESAAAYNDKGFIWMGHSEEKSAELRKGFQTRLQDLANQLGRDVLGPELYRAIESGGAAHDGSGVFVDIARARFGGAKGQ
jgi:hypothetical protein